MPESGFLWFLWPLVHPAAFGLLRQAPVCPPWCQLLGGHRGWPDTVWLCEKPAEEAEVFSRLNREWFMLGAQPSAEIYMTSSSSDLETSVLSVWKDVIERWAASNSFCYFLKLTIKRSLIGQLCRAEKVSWVWTSLWRSLFTCQNAKCLTNGPMVAQVMSCSNRSDVQVPTLLQVWKL